MLFSKHFKVVEIHERGVITTRNLRGSRMTVNAAIETFKQKSKKYEMVGKTGMIVWM